MRAVAGLIAAVLALVFGSLPDAVAQGSDKRIALVVGNSNYTYVGKLPNPRGDAERMAAALRALNFKVTLVLDADQVAMRKAMVAFGRALRESDVVGLFYYAGHGLQVGARNYLIPVSANIQDETEVGIESVGLEEFLATMERPGNPINIVILDACRDNPFPRAFRTSNAGLAPIEAPRGSYLAYATSPGSTASDGYTGSPYSTALIRAMQMDGLSIEEVFKQTRRDVLTETKGSQTPWETSSITRDFVFKPGAANRTAVVPPPPPKPESSVEITFWNSIKDSTNRAAFEAYLAQFPRGSFAALARVKVAELKPVVQQIAVPPPSPPPGKATPPARRRNDVLPHSGTRELAESEVAGLSCDALWEARNEMFHRHGYCFETARGLAVFGREGCRTTSQDVLNAVERANFRILRSLELRRQCGAAPTTVSAYRPPDTSSAGAPAAGTECDRLAGADWDQDFSGPGVDFGRMNASRAIAACQVAVRTAPGERRFAFQLGRALDKARDYVAAREAYQVAAGQGSAAAMVNLGILFEKGQGVARNPAEARANYERAARIGSGMGAFCYATALDSGNGGRQDLTAALQWYQRAESLGVARARMAAARLRSSGRPTGTPCD
jgi:hypothetical protein